MSNTLTDKEKKLLEKWVNKGIVYITIDNDEGYNFISVREGKRKNPSDERYEPETLEYNSEDDWEDLSE